MQKADTHTHMHTYINAHFYKISFNANVFKMHLAPRTLHCGKKWQAVVEEKCWEIHASIQKAIDSSIKQINATASKIHQFQLQTFLTKNYIQKV